MQNTQNARIFLRWSGKNREFRDFLKELKASPERYEAFRKSALMEIVSQ